MKRGKTYGWIPLHIDKWIFGSTRIELEPAERAVWIDLMVLAAKDDGHVRANDSTPYLPQQLSGLLCISTELLESTIVKCIKFGKVERRDNGTLYLINWDQYQLSSRWQRQFTSAKTEHTSEKAEPIQIHKHIQKPIQRQKQKAKNAPASPILNDVIAYLNEKSGKRFRPDTGNTAELVNGRIAEGRTIEDFQHVIDVKCTEWLGDQKMDKFIRPATLFAKSNFDSYLNERVITRRGVGAGPEKSAAERDVTKSRAARIAAVGDRIDAKHRPGIEAAQASGDVAAFETLRQTADAEYDAEVGKIMRGEV